ncbi:MAG TPA: hypothetical protein VKH42_03225 [Vicinamibacterales bacterium]|nr:hypothetical protein [Vicinamibacterales bacterium]
MSKALSFVAGIAAASVVAAGCVQHSNTVDMPGTTTSPSGTSAGPSLIGLWTTATQSTGSTCQNFQFQITSQTASSVAGTFAATCAGYPVTGSANGTMNGNNVTINVSGAGSVSGVPVCPFQFTSNATIQDNGDTIVLPYSGTTCLGPISGTQTLHRP